MAVVGKGIGRIFRPPQQERKWIVFDTVPPAWAFRRDNCRRDRGIAVAFKGALMQCTF